MSGEFEAVGQPERARDGSTYQAEVQRAASRDGTWRWQIMRYNPPSTVPMGSPVRAGSANSHAAAETQARLALVRVAGA